VSAGIATRFPLVSRGKPVCRPLPARIAELDDAAARAEQAQTSAYQRLVAASEVYNKAALIASDCGLPGTARELCWQQWDTYAMAVGEESQSAELLKLSLQPILNLARQLIRDQQSQAAHRLLIQLFVAANKQQQVQLRGRVIPLDLPHATDNERLVIRQHLWAALLADGSRAMIAQQRWTEALELAKKFNGVGNRLLDGRQILIIATALGSTPDEALGLLEETKLTDRWEEAVAATLRLFVLHHTGHPKHDASIALVEQCRELLDRADSSMGSFAARLAAVAADLLADAHPAQCAELAAALTQFAGRSPDAYVAREALACPPARNQMKSTESAALAEITRASGLSIGALPEHEQTDLRTHVRRAESVILEVSATLTSTQSH
jgi:hypothetical protein